MSESQKQRATPAEQTRRRGCRSWGPAVGLVLLGLLVCLGGSVVGLAVAGVLMFEGYLPALPSGPATATITRVPTPVPTTRPAPTAMPLPATVTATALPNWTVTATPYATDSDTMWPDDVAATVAATPTSTLTPIGAPTQPVVPTPTDTLTPIGAPARPATPTGD